MTETVGAGEEGLRLTAQSVRVDVSKLSCCA